MTELRGLIKSIAIYSYLTANSMINVSFMFNVILVVRVRV